MKLNVFVKNVAEHQRFLFIDLNHCIPVLQMLSRPQVYKIQHKVMQTAATNACERRVHSQVLDVIHCGTMTG